ncbi:SNARE associated Golgi protein [Hartmannibacter diazotrophicus]|uniref:SNARE associated Golgi protein n=1 Tax=Hartmannibacter diazotrophicus TaxID=1482074 RepID=A0A2C9D3I3_9HYPH|nr:YqaA family protein [Hartmannibacter diazotrophicus]SON54824.1 SNARE associated Golgi protein [Hartmannibacter diazotrophicus]
MLRRLYDWTMSLAASRHAVTALGAISFIESSVFPIPPDTLLIPMVIAERRRAWWYATLATISSVLGGIAGYLIGAFLFDQVAWPILTAYGYADKFETFRGWYNDWGVWIVLVAGVTPFPFKVITIASGATGLNMIVFVLASIIARGARFFAVAALLYVFGPPIKDFIERRLGLVFTVAMVLLIGGFVVARYAV